MIEGSHADKRPLLSVTDLNVAFPTPRGIVEAVRDVSFNLCPGERVAIVGESGSGKSVSALSLVGLVPRPGRVSGSITFEAREIVGMHERHLVAIRGRGIGMVPQDAIRALNPLRTIGSQLEEAVMVRGGSRAEARSRALDYLREVRIGEPELRMKQLGYEMSGGMAQRIMIAAALAPRPSILVADEPTSSLDATTALGILDLLATLSREHSMAMVMITHDLGAVAHFADRVIVMYAGRIVEDAPADQLLSRPRHPYTRGLLDSVPSRDGALGRGIQGTVPDPTALPPGCAFRPRCARSKDRVECHTVVPPLIPSEIFPAQRAACHFKDEPQSDSGSEVALPIERHVAGETPLLTVAGLSKRFTVKRSRLGSSGEIHAVSDVSFTIRRGEVVGLVGESGSGKSTTARMILGLETPDQGSVTFDGQPLPSLARRDRSLHRRIQVVFQNPDSSLDPRMKIGDIIAEPLRVFSVGDNVQRRDRCRSLIFQVGLDEDHLDRYPFQPSGGQRQRVAIARALAVRPELIVCDEPVTALDVSVQAQVLNLLLDVQKVEKLAYLFVAHDLGVVRQVANRVAVMYLGQIVELAEAEKFFTGPHHPYSVALLGAVTSLDSIKKGDDRPRVVLPGEVPSPLDPPSACRFHTRCWKAQPLCSQVAPPLREISPGREAACHFPEHTARAPGDHAAGPVQRAGDV